MPVAVVILLLSVLLLVANDVAIDVAVAVVDNVAFAVGVAVTGLMIMVSFFFLSHRNAGRRT